jgi:hypothetical protein
VGQLEVQLQVRGFNSAVPVVGCVGASVECRIRIAGVLQLPHDHANVQVRLTRRSLVHVNSVVLTVAHPLRGTHGLRDAALRAVCNSITHPACTL